jgi:hypothetical protein
MTGTLPRAAFGALLRAAAGALLIAGAACEPGPAGPPNIIFVFSDDHAANAIGAYGSRINATPNLDRLAAEGMLFRNAFVTNSICGPSRATVLTGQYGHLNGVPTNTEELHPATMTFPKLLRAGGYRTALIGKWHLKSLPEGFDHYEILDGQGPYYNPRLFRPGDTIAIEGYTTDIITERAIEWLESARRGRQPFLLMYQHKAPHRPWDPGPDHFSLYEDVEIPEPPTLFDDWAGRTSAAKMQEMTIAHHLNDRDLKLVAPPGLTPSQSTAWDAAYGPPNRSTRSTVSRETTSSAGSTSATSRTISAPSLRSTTTSAACSAGSTRTGSPTTPWSSTLPTRASISASTAGSTNAGCTRSRSARRCSCAGPASSPPAP